MTIQDRAAKVLREIDEQLALAEKATPGPWYDIPHPEWSRSNHRIDKKPDASWASFGQICYVGESNAAFIAASRTGWPTALRCLKTAIEAIIDGVEVYGTSSSWELQLRRICDQWEASRK